MEQEKIIEEFIGSNFRNFHTAGGSYGEKAYEAVIKTIEQTLPLTNLFLEKYNFPYAKSQYVRDFCPEDCKQEAAFLGELFNKYSSDKAVRHGYEFFYGPIFKDIKETATSILEIGIAHGGSTRALRDYFPNATIYGADINIHHIIVEERVELIFVDQTDSESLKQLGKKIPDDSLDVIIDDGLHNIRANLMSLTFGFGKLKKNGWLIIEDIHPESVVFWKILSSILIKDHECFLVQGTFGEYIFAIHKS